LKTTIMMICNWSPRAYRQPFEPHNLLSAQYSPALYQTSSWPPDLKNDCPLVPRKEPRYTILFSLKLPASKSPPGFPMGPYREREKCPLTGKFYIVLGTSFYLKFYPSAGYNPGFSRGVLPDIIPCEDTFI
jgi:hypothetical protein